MNRIYLIPRILCLAGIAILILYYGLSEFADLKLFFLLPLGFLLAIIGATIAFLRMIKTINMIKKMHDESNS